MNTLHAVTVYIPDHIWQTLQTDARRHHTTIPDAIVDTLERTVPRAPKARPSRAVAAPRFAPLLRQERERRGWSGYEMARRVDVDHSLIWRYEAGQRVPSRYTVGRLATVLQLSPKDTTTFYHAAGFVWEGIADAS